MNIPGLGIDRYLRELAQIRVSDVELVIAPPFTYLSHVHSILRTIGLRAAVSAQNCSEHEAGAFTGEVAAMMLRDVGAAYVMVGHSERRALFGEDDVTVGRKLRTATAAGLVPILCVGEDEGTRKREATESLLSKQLEVALRDYPSSATALIAYEPVWAIGTGQNATAEVAAEAQRFIRRKLGQLGFSQSWTILYGGSVSPENAAELAAEQEIDGFLVGGASLEISKFKGIYEAMTRPGSGSAQAARGSA